MNRKIELLAPGGDIDCIKAAILGGADAIYCGLDKFNARNRAANISFEDLKGVLRLAHKNDCEIFLTLNIVIVESEIRALINLLNKLVNTGIDGVIIQDLGLFYLLKNYFKSLKVHASTQLTTHNEGQIKFLNRLTATRVNLCRELNIQEIKALTKVGAENNIATEVFVHGSYCISFSGLCYISSVLSGNSGNRGRCSQPCRDRYVTTAEGKNYPLNLKDNSAYFDLKELYDAGVYSLKIEGRIKKFDYVYTVVDAWKKQIQSFADFHRLNSDNSILYKVFNRDFSNSFLKGDIGENMFIDNPRDHSIKHLSEINSYSSDTEKEHDKLALYAQKDKIKATVENNIKKLSIEKEPIDISVSGNCGLPIKVTVKTPDNSFVVLSRVNLADKGTQPLDYQMVLKRFKALNDTEYYIRDLELESINGDVFIPFKELTWLKNRVLNLLSGSREVIEPVDVPVLKKRSHEIIKPTLSVLISSVEDLSLCDETSANIYFQLPNGFKDECSQLQDLFLENRKLIPWFPSVLIGEDYAAALEFLQRVQPKLIVTNNTGIAYEAYKKGIQWIAGPYINSVNSFSLLCLKENFNCVGSFISNELSRDQIRNIKSPENFNLFYSIYHPIVLMTSRQCLFQQVTGCKKNKMDNTCIQQCDRSSKITNMKDVSFCIEKSKGNYHTIYNETNFLNTDIVTDIPNIFSSFFIDLRDIKTNTQIEIDKAGIIRCFEDLLDGKPDSKNNLKQIIHPSTKAQYSTGI